MFDELNKIEAFKNDVSQEQLQIAKNSKLLTDQKVNNIYLQFVNVPRFWRLVWVRSCTVFLVYHYVITIFYARPFNSQISYWNIEFIFYFLKSEIDANFNLFTIIYASQLLNNKVSNVLLLHSSQNSKRPNITHCFSTALVGLVLGRVCRGRFWSW